jgi:uncharacterized protein
MKRLLALVCAAMVVGAFAPLAAVAQDADDFAVLVYSRTGGFRHLSIPDGIRAIEGLGDEHGFAVEATEDPTAFRDDNLARFAAVVFLNTTGDVLDDEGRDAFERYLRGGGGYVGVHSAADTEYDWAFYGEILAGAWFLAHPVQQPGTLDVEGDDHPATAHLPERWTLPLEEFYSFVRNPREDVTVLISIDESTYQQDPNTSHIPRGPEFPDGTTGVMGDHPMSWCHEIDAGRVWYSALGHESYLYYLPDYRQHLLGGILTAAGQVAADCAPPTPEPAPTETGTESSAPPAPTDQPAPAPAPADGTGSGGGGGGLPATGAGFVLPALAALAAASRLRQRR